ncbi:MAG TPA: hypothetical protein PLZ57_08835 [Pseudobdellovibrionaceae bacterium]|nr:hypothetical protein [Pseudobdellovibrionaceae bacterium]
MPNTNRILLTAKWLTLMIGSTLLALLAVEGIYRLDRERPTSLTTNASGLIPAGDLQRAAMRKAVQPRIDRLWLTPPDQRPNIFSPPLDTFVNRGFDDPERMQRILTRTRLPVSQQWKVPNFLRHPDSPSLHTITSTAEGFRSNDGQMSAPLTKRTTSQPIFRVLVLGSYPAFGHAVNDDETYAARLETSMNSPQFQNELKAQGCTRPPRFQFLNGGRQGATAIMGWSRLSAEGDQIRPDLIIWDYGWIEKYLRTDQGDTGGGDAERIRRVGSSIQQLRRLCARSQLRRWELCIRLERKVTELDREASLSGWREANRRAQQWARERKIPIVFLRHDGVSIDRSEYEPYHQPAQNSYLIDTTSAVRDVPATAEEVEAFWSKPNWLDEIGVTKEQVSNQAIIIMRTDAIQYNELGYRRIASVVLSQLAHLSGRDAKNLKAEGKIDLCTSGRSQTTSTGPTPQSPKSP